MTCLDQTQLTNTLMAAYLGGAVGMAFSLGVIGWLRFGR